MTSPAPARLQRSMGPPRTAGGVVTPASGSIALAAEHFAAATLYLLAGSFGLVWIAPELAAGNYSSPHVAGVTHLFTLGWLTTTIFGALYQLLPVALAAPVRWRTLGHASFWTFVPGAGVFAAGVASGAMALRVAGITLLTVGIVLAVWNIGWSMRASRSRDVTWKAVAVALAYLSSTLVLGALLLHNLHTGFIAAARIRVLATHLHVAVIGWALVMIVGVSNRLLPMFLLAHGADTRWTPRAVLLLAIGVVMLGTGLTVQLNALSWAAVVVLEAGLACFVWQAWSFHRVRVRKKIDIGMRFAMTAIGFLVIAAVLGPMVLAVGLAHPRLGTAYVALGLLGGIVLYVVGFFYKIVPLLAWTARYGGRMGKETLPTVAQMYSQRVAWLQFFLMAVGLLLLGGGILGGFSPATESGAVLFLGGVSLFASQIVRVAFGGKR